MPRKKKDAAITAVAAETSTEPAMSRPEYIDGPPVDESGHAIRGSFQTPEPTLTADPEPTRGEARNWGDPYKAIVTTPAFEMGENRRFKQRVFIFQEKPSDDVLTTLKENGFTYRANEKAWTVPANPESRKFSEDFAHELAGNQVGLAR